MLAIGWQNSSVVPENATGPMYLLYCLGRLSVGQPEWRTIPKHTLIPRFHYLSVRSGLFQLAPDTTAILQHFLVLQTKE